MTRLMIFLITILTTLTSFSQIDTRDSIVCLPIGTARLIAADLLEYDKCKLVLKETEELNRLADKRINRLLETIVSYENRSILYQKELAATQSLYDTCEVRRIELKTEVEDLTIKNERLKKWSIGLGSGFVATLGALLLVVAIK